MNELLHGEEERAFGDSGYIGAKKRPDAVKKNKSGKNIKYIINRRPSSIKKLSKSDQYAAKKNEKNYLSVVKLNMFSQSLSDYSGIGKHDTEVCKNRLPKIISCLHWQICIWLIENLCRYDSVRLTADN